MDEGRGEMWFLNGRGTGVYNRRDILEGASPWKRKRLKGGRE
jgi:hypothetical protein